ncbi:MAG: hydantoinase/oxoprolinase family protein [Candidatus Thiodiazotropha endolucinida]
MPHDAILGWDLGGAHTKAALIDSRGCVERVEQIPCPLWQGLEYLDSGIDSVVERIGNSSGLKHAVTMTGELVDLFPDRDAGVKALIDTMGRHFSGASLAIYAGSAGFLNPENAVRHSPQVASANWLATASWVASRLPEGLLVDVGSTTTDLIAFADKQVLACDYSDHQRLVSQALIYTGVVRTPLMAITDKVPFAGEWVYLMAEHFATTADIYRLNGELPETADLLPSADNGEKSVNGSARRLARMLGLDVDATDIDGWCGVSRYIAEQQLRQLVDACERVLSRPGFSTSAPLVGAGVGRFLVERICHRLARPYVGVEELFTCAKWMETKVAECAPAVAVASLAKDRAP